MTVETPPMAGDPDRSWVIVDRGSQLVTGPARAFGDDTATRANVSVGQPVPADELGPIVAETHIAESGVRSFVVPWYAVDGRTVAVNPAGGNQVSWDAAGRQFHVTPAADAHVTSVYVRFVLRHLTTSILEQDFEGRSVHAVTGVLATEPVRLLAVAGPTRSGKTRLMNRLLVAGLVGRVVDDDCPVLAHDGSVVTHVPRRYEVERTTTAALAVLVLVSDSVQRAREVDHAYAQEFLANTPVPWPATWLPAPERRPTPQLPDARIFEVPAQDEHTYQDVLGFVGSDSNS